MEVSEAKRLKQLEDENARLKRLLADAMLDNAALKDLITQKNSDARRQARGCPPSRIRLRDERAPGVPPDQGRSQDRPLSIASTARRRLARPPAGAGGRAAPVRLSPAAHSAARRGPRFESKEDAAALPRGGPDRPQAQEPQAGDGHAGRQVRRTTQPEANRRVARVTSRDLPEGPRRYIGQVLARIS